MFSKSSLLLAFFTISSSVSAQVTHPAVRRGPLAGAGALLSLHEPAGGTESVYVKDAGDQSQSPPVWPATHDSQFGNYSMEALFPTHSNLVEIDAMSSGNAFLSTDEGEVQLGTQWAAVTISVTNDAQGTAGDGWIERRATLPNRNTPGSDLATHYLPGGNGIHGTLIGETYISQMAEHIGLPNDEDIDSLDIALGVFESATGAESRLLFQNQGVFFFSLSRDSANALVLANVDFARESANGPYVRPNPVDVYVMGWDDNSNSWSKPVVAVSVSDLKLDPDVDDIDAIDVSLQGHGYPMVFSTQPVFGRPQLLVYEFDQAGTGSVYPLVSEDGLVVTDGFYLYEGTDNGLDNGDDVDAVCFFDPEIGKYDNLVGIPVGGTGISSGPSQGGSPLGLSVMWEDDDEYFFHVSGRVPNPGPGPGPGPDTAKQLVIEFSSDYSVSNPSGATWTTIKTGTYLGKVTELHAALPAGHGLAQTDEMYFRAKVYASATQQNQLRSSWVSALDYYIAP